MAGNWHYWQTCHLIAENWHYWQRGHMMPGKWQFWRLDSGVAKERQTALCVTIGETITVKRLASKWVEGAGTDWDMEHAFFY